MDEFISRLVDNLELKFELEPTAADASEVIGVDRKLISCDIFSSLQKLQILVLLQIQY